MIRGDRRAGRIRASLRSRPRAEAMEKRELMTVTPDTFAAADQLAQANAIVGGFAASVASDTVSAAAATSVTLPLAGSSQGLVTPLGSTGVPASLIPQSPYQGDDPTAAELANEKYTAVFTGYYTTAAPRFADQSSQTYIQAVGSTTNELHGDIQLSIVVPNGATSTNPLDEVVGVGVNLDKSTATSSVLAIDVYGNPTTSLNSKGLPTQLQYSFSPYNGAGSFTGGLYNLAEGAGTITVSYKPNGKKFAPGIISKGTVTVTIQGLLYTSGVTSSLATANLEVSHSVPKPFGQKVPKVVHKADSSPILKTKS